MEFKTFIAIVAGVNLLFALFNKIKGKEWQFDAFIATVLLITFYGSG